MGLMPAALACNHIPRWSSLDAQHARVHVHVCNLFGRQTAAITCTSVAHGIRSGNGRLAHADSQAALQLQPSHPSKAALHCFDHQRSMCPTFIHRHLLKSSTQTLVQDCQGQFVQSQEAQPTLVGLLMCHTPFMHHLRKPSLGGPPRHCSYNQELWLA